MINLKKLKVALIEIFILKILFMKDYLFSNRFKSKFEKYKNKKKLLLTLVPYHDNLGDHAIAYASKKFLEDKFPEFEIIEVDIREIYKYGKSIKNIMASEDLVFILGGGNLGDLYRFEEWTRRFIIKTFKEFKITQLPATAHFTNTSKGKYELNKSKSVYSSHNNLLLIARDDTTFDFMRTHFKKNIVIKNPDMVLYLNNRGDVKTRNEIMVCLREDKESFLDIKERSKITNYINSKFGDYQTFTTTINKRVSAETRDDELNILWNNLRSAKIVVTDRLHGMIFCVITRTPCVVIRSFDHKVVEGFFWLKDLNYLKLVEKPTEETISKAIVEMIQINEVNVNKVDFNKLYFNNLREEIFSNGNGKKEADYSKTGS